MNVEDNNVLVASVEHDGEPAQMVAEHHARDLIMVMKMKCIWALKGSWRSGAIVSIGLQSGENGGGFPYGKEAFVKCSP
jgi:hypothetical protein